MSKKNSNSDSGNGRKIRIGGLLVLITGLAVYGWSIYSKYTGGLPWEQGRTDRQVASNPQQENTRPEGPPRNRGARRQRMQQMMKELNLTEDQQAKIKDIWEQGRHENRKEGRQRFQAMLSILTPEQQVQARQMMQSRMQRRVQRMQEKGVSGEEIQEVEERIEERMNNFLGPPSNPKNR
jgi:hypothetical protein